MGFLIKKGKTSRRISLAGSSIIQVDLIRSRCSLISRRDQGTILGQHLAVNLVNGRAPIGFTFLKLFVWHEQIKRPVGNIDADYVSVLNKSDRPPHERLGAHVADAGALRSA